MAVFSKHSPLWIEHSCYELGHTWTPYCSKAVLGIGSIAFKKSIQIYLAFYVISAVIHKHGKLTPKCVQQILQDVFQSTVFLSFNAFSFIGLFCTVWRVFGGYHYSFGMLTGIPACAIALQIERRNRRGLLALYTANIAAETWFNMLVARGYARRIKYGEVLLFSITSAVCMLLFKSKNLLAPDIESMLKKFVGNEESGNAEKVNCSSATSKSVEVYLPKFLQKFVKVIIAKLKAEPTHKLCKHTSSCLYSCVASFCRQFGIGYIIQMVLNILKSLTRLKQNPKGLLRALYRSDNFYLGAFLGLYSSIFKALCCTFRWFRKTDHPIHGLIAGFVAGLSSSFYRSTTITLYFLLKILQNLYDNCVKDGYLPTIPHGNTILYALSTSLVLHASVMEPQHIRPSYWNFLLRLTGNRFREMNRKLLDQMGTQASKLYPNDWPDYDPKFTSLQPR